MATQCRSPRCTAERKGFRRELDSWRHRLIHCVGFESILEGLYGPGLRRDLSLFDDCEPEELVDWCADDRCSLCSLRKDTVSDCTPSADSAQSTPTGELISQGQFNAEKIECQAENYLNALFQKKDLPQNCDPNIPLVAQELMKKMIRQFAIEYVSKSRKLHQENNGTVLDPAVARNGVQLNQDLLQEEQDGPLDLTVTRIEENFQCEDGVLDLSIKKNGLEENSKMKNSKIGVINIRILKKLEKSIAPHKKISALMEVFNSLCQYHKQQLKLMFRFLTKEHKLCSKMCNKNEKVNTFMNQRLTRNGVLESPYLNLPPVYVRLKDLRLTCPNIACGTVKLNAKEHVDLHIKQCDPVSNSETIRSRRKHAYCGNFNCCDTPSSSKRRKTCYSASEWDDATHSELDFSLLPGKQISNVGILDKSINSLFEDLICCIAKKMNGTDAKPYPQELCSIPKLIDTVQMRNLVDHLINKIKQNGYSFTQALNQYLKSTETRFSQTRFCKRREKAAVWHSPALSLSRRQSLRIKRELCNLMENFSQARTTPVNNSEKGISNKERPYGVLVVKKYGNAPTVATTNLPHCNLTMHSNTVDFSNDYFCLPGHLVLSPTQTNTHGKEKIQSHIGSNTTVGDGVSSNYCSGGLESYKESLVSQGRYSVQNASNLFCKCTSKQFSGTIQDTRVDGVQPAVTADVSRNTHLKVVIERLKDPFMSTNTKSSRLKRKHKSKRKETSFVLHSGIENTCSNNKVSLRPNVNKNTCTNAVPQDESAKSKLTMVAANHKCNPLTGNRLCSPVKIMFVSKIDGAEGMKYTLSSVYNSSNQKSKVNFLEISDKVDKTSGEEAAAAHEQSEKQLVNDPLYFSSVSTRKTNDCEKNTSTKEHRCREVRVEKRKAERSKHVGSPCLKQIRLEREPTQQHDKGMQSSDKPNEPEGGNTLPSRNKSTEHSKITLSIRFGKSTFKRHILKMNSPPAEEINLKKSQTHSYDSTKKVSQGSDTVPTTRSFTLLHSRTSVTHKPLPVTTECTPPKEGVRLGANTVFHLQKTRLFPKQGLGFKFYQKRKFYNTRSTRSSALRSCQIPSQANRDTSALHSSEAFSALSSSQSLLDKANTQSINKHKVHDRTLVTQKPCESPSTTMECLEDNDKSPVITSQTSVDSVSQSNEVLKWWSTSTPSDSLLKDLDSRYEQMINTWQKNTSENHFSPTFQLQVQQQIRSPIQMLFEKKYDMSNISTWFMQTTETKSLSILPKANARSPMEISNHKGAKAGKTQVSVISRNSRKRQRNCMRLTHLDALNGHQRISQFVQPENVVGINTKIRELKCQEKLNLNNIPSVTHKSKPVQLKFRHLGDNLEDANVDERKSSSELASTRISTSVNSLPVPRGRISNLLGKKEMAKRRITYVSKSTENFKGCKVFITKCKDIETKTPPGNVCSSEQLHLSNATELKKCTIQSTPKVDLNTDANSQGRKSLKTLSLTLKAKNSLNEEPGRNVRKSRGTVFTKASPTCAWISEKRNDRKRRKNTSVCRNTSPKKPRLLSVIGKAENDYSKYLLGPLKPVRLPSTKGLSSKHGMYSLTPIRIPDSRRTKQGNTNL